MDLAYPESRKSIEIGQTAPDGTVCAGISPDAYRPFFAAPVDAPLTYTFNDAAEYVTQLNEQNYLGHNDWRVPTKAELNVLFTNRAAIGGFNERGEYPTGTYWSSSRRDYDFAFAQRFSDGKSIPQTKNERVESALRPVRS